MSLKLVNDVFNVLLEQLSTKLPCGTLNHIPNVNDKFNQLKALVIALMCF